MERDDRIRRRAHELWEREGRPAGRHEAHWEQARREIEAADADRATAGRDHDTGAALAGDPTGMQPGPVLEPALPRGRTRRKPGGPT